MSLLCFFKQKDRLPDPRGTLSTPVTNMARAQPIKCKRLPAMKSSVDWLLPTLYRSFVELVYSEATYFPSLQPIEENSIPGKRWVLSRLHSHFGDMLHASMTAMEHCCSTRIVTC